MSDAQDIEFSDEQVERAYLRAVLIRSGLFHLKLDFLGAVRDGVDYERSTNGLIRGVNGYYRAARDNSHTPPRKLILFANDARKLTGKALKTAEGVYIVQARLDVARGQSFLIDIEGHSLYHQMERFYKLTLHMGRPENKEDGSGLKIPVTNGQIVYSIEQENGGWAVHLHTRFDVNKDETNMSFLPAGGEPPEGFGKSFSLYEEDGKTIRQFETSEDALSAIRADWNKRVVPLSKRLPAVGPNPEKEATVGMWWNQFKDRADFKGMTQKAGVSGSLSFATASLAIDPAAGVLVAAYSVATAVAGSVLSVPVGEAADALATVVLADHPLMQNLALSEMSFLDEYVDKTVRNYESRTCKPLRPDDELLENLTLLTQDEAGLIPDNEKMRPGFDKDWAHRVFYTAPYRDIGGISTLLHGNAQIMTFPGFRWMMVNKRDDHGAVRQTDVYVTKGKVGNLDPHEHVDFLLKTLESDTVLKISLKKGETEIEAQKFTHDEFEEDIPEIMKAAKQFTPEGAVNPMELVGAEGVIADVFINGLLGLDVAVATAMTNNKRIEIDAAAKFIGPKLP